MANNENNLDAYNAVEVALGGAGTQPNDMVAVRAIAVLEGVSGGPADIREDNMRLRLNAIDVGAGGLGTHLNTLDALNSIVILKGGVGGHFNDLDAINEWVDVAVAFTGIFDTISGGVVGYSIGRRLSSTYSGPLIRVRESGLNAELDIGVDANGDLDTAAMETHTGANDGFVVKIYDQSGNADDSVQATASKQPKIVSAGTTIVDGNGNPIAQFDGTDDTMQAPSVALDSYASVYVVGKFTTAKPMLIEHGPNVSTDDGFLFFGQQNRSWNVFRTSIHGDGNVPNWMGASLAQVTFIYGGSGAYYLDGAVQSNNSPIGSDVGDSAATDALNLLSRNQASLFSDGDFYELLIFDGAHVSGDQDTVESDQKAKYTTP